MERCFFGINVNVVGRILTMNNISHKSMGFKILRRNKHTAPEPDVAMCSSCGWRGKVYRCPVEQEGDWESGYYDIHLCPKCEDGGCVDGYTYSRLQYLRLILWRLREEIRKRVRLKRKEKRA